MPGSTKLLQGSRSPLRRAVNGKSVNLSTGGGGAGSLFQPSIFSTAEASTLSPSFHFRNGLLPRVPRVVSAFEAPASSSPSGSAVLGIAAFTLFSTTFTTAATKKKRSLCEDTLRKRVVKAKTVREETSSDSKLKDLPDNPLWPKGVTCKDVDELVEDCLRDPSMNILAVPDYIERQIYHSTITITLNALYQSLSEMHGQQILGHEFRLQRMSAPKSGLPEKVPNDVQEAILEKVADRLLANKAVNHVLIPDVVERQLYVNCLKIMFRVLDLLTTSFRLTFCGHDLRFQMEPSARYSIQEAVFTRASSSLTEIDMEAMKKFAREAGVDMSDPDKGRWFWQKLFHPSNNEFVAQLHAALYSLVLGVMDDLLANTELELLSDRIQFDIVPSTPEPSQRGSPENESPVDLGVRSGGRRNLARALPMLTFSIGVGVGIALMGLFGRN